MSKSVLKLRLKPGILTPMPLCTKMSKEILTDFTLHSFYPTQWNLRWEMSKNITHAYSWPDLGVDFICITLSVLEIPTPFYCRLSPLSLSTLDGGRNTLSYLFKINVEWKLFLLLISNFFQTLWMHL